MCKCNNFCGDFFTYFAVNRKEQKIDFKTMNANNFTKP